MTPAPRDRAAPRTIAWQRRDLPALEIARLERDGEGWRLSGTAFVVRDEVPWELRYAVGVDSAWRTRSARVEARRDGEQRIVGLAASPVADWQVDGRPAPALAGCLDVDLGFSPVTNTLPIRRLELAVGEAAEVAAAWVRFPALDVVVLRQSYRREGERRYRYRSDTGFETLIEVDDAGLVVDYPPAWRAVASC